MKNIVFTFPVFKLLGVVILGLLAAGCADDVTGGAPAAGSPDQARSSSGRSGEGVTTVGTLELAVNTSYSARSFYTGRVEAGRRSDLGFELGGLLQEVTVDEGETIKAGAMLAQLDADRLDAQLFEVKAAVVQAEAQVGLARSTLARLEEARSFDGVSDQQFDEAVNAAASAEASLLAAQARLKRVQVDRSKSRLLAPYDAVVLARHYDEGQVLNPGQPVLTVQETGQLEVRMGIAGDAVSALEAGDRLALIINDQPASATLKAVVPARDAVARTVDVVFSLEVSSTEGKSRIRSGDLARLELRRPIDAEGYWVPLTALAEGERGLWNAYVVVRAEPSGSGRYEVESRAVEVLYQDGSRAYVNGALQPGDLLVPSGLNRIVPGQRVRINSGGV